jgi:chemotaxis protein histidine kinase CheA
MSNTFDKLSVLDSFIEEVNSYLPEIETNLERLAQSPGDMDALEETYRRTHTIGGSASMMDFPGLAHVAHGMEDILGDALDGMITPDKPTLGLLGRSLGRLHQLLEGIRSGIDEDAVIAEDDADYDRYRAETESPAPAPELSSSGSYDVPTSPIEERAVTPSTPFTPSMQQGLSELPTPVLSPVPPMPSVSSSMPSFDEVLASFRTPSTTPGDDGGWPEEPELVTRFDNTASMSSVPSTPLAPNTPVLLEPPVSPAPSVSVQPPMPQQIPPSAFDVLMASTRHSAISVPSQHRGEQTPSKLQAVQQPQTPKVPPAQSSFLASAPTNEVMTPSPFPIARPVELSDRKSLTSSESVPTSGPAAFGGSDQSVQLPVNREQALVPSLGTEKIVPPAVYVDMQREAGTLDSQIASLKTVVSQLRDAMTVIDAQRGEFKGFLNGSKDALDRMEVWAGKAMGLNLRNSPEQVRRYLPLSVMWVSNSKLKKVLDLLYKITSGVEQTDEQFSESLQQLQASIQSCGEAFEQLYTDQSVRTENGWRPWQVSTDQDASTLRERVTFERQGDPTVLRTEIETQVRNELLQEQEALQREIDLLRRNAQLEHVALERRIRDEVRQEYEQQPNSALSSVSGNVDAATLKSIEDRLRGEIEIKVRQEFLSQIMSANDGSSSLAPDQGQTGKTESVIAHVMPPSSTMASAPVPSPTSSSSLAMSNDFNEEAAEIFRLEAEEHLQTISMHVAALEKNPTNRDLIQGIRRATHTLKGAAGMMGFSSIADLSHVSEDLLDLIVEGTMAISPSVVSLILDTAESLEALITGNTSSEVDAKIRELNKRYVQLLGERSPTAQQMEQLDEDLEEDDHQTQVAGVLTHNQGGEANIRSARQDLSVRVRLQKLDELINLFGEMLVNRSVLEERISRLTRLVSDVAVSSNRLADVGQKLESRFEAATLPSGRSVQVMPGEGVQSLVARNNALQQLTGLQSVPNLPVLANQNGKNGRNGVVPEHLSEFDELELDRYTEFHQLARGLSEGISDMATLSTEMDTIIRECEGVFSRENRLNTTFQDRLMKVRLVPLLTMGSRLYRAARAVALKQGKDVDFVLEGETTEVDRTVYEEIAGPLLHLVRNAVNHAIEIPEERVKRGKSPTGQIKLSASYEGNQIMITVRDDGNGIDRDNVRRTAISRGLIRPDQQLSEDEVVSLIFRPGFSTAGVVSEESGRGVGLDVVRDSVSRLRGTLVVESAPGMGTAFTMTFPTSLAIQSAMMVKVAGQQFAIPTVNVESIGRLDNFKQATSGAQPAVLVRNELYPLQMLAQYLSLPLAPTLEEKAQLLLVNAGGHRVALVVDEINGKFDLVMKSLGPHLRDVHGIAGGTILGNGRVILVLELNTLLATNTKISASVVGGRRESLPPVQPRPTTIGPNQGRQQRVDLSTANHQRASLSSQAPAPTGSERGKHILVVDDSPSVRRVVSNMLKQNGWVVQMARDGVEALEMITNETPAAVLLDIEMPRMDGYELISTVRAQEQYRTLPLIVLTSRAASKHQQRAMTLGASGYVVKPYQDEELLNTINALVYGAVR